MPKSSPKRRQRRHGDLPAGFKWRDGRPRWEPSPARRAAGWRGVDLKDVWGKWLAKGPAIERAQAIVDAVGAWAAGAAVPGAWLAIAPKGAEAARPAGTGPRAIGTLLEAYYADRAFTRLAAATQADYRSKIGRFLKAVAKSDAPAKLERLKGLDMDLFLPPAFGSDEEFVLADSYGRVRDDAGDAMANGALAALSAWFGWCVQKRRLWAVNPAALVDRVALEGRIEVYDWPELVALVRAADAAGLASIGDAIVLAVDLSWSQQDLLALRRDQVGDNHHVKHRRIKTGVAGNPPLLAIGRARMAQIRGRWEGQTVQPTHVLVCELTGQPWVADTFRHHFAEIRAKVALTMPSVAAKQFRDLRDTAVTYAYDAGNNVEEICSRTLHKVERASAVLLKHYGQIRQVVSDRAAERLDAHYAKMGYTFDELLALPPPAKEG